MKKSKYMAGGGKSSKYKAAGGIQTGKEAKIESYNEYVKKNVWAVVIQANQL